MNRELLVDVVARLPQGVLSRGWGWLARRRHPKPFVKALKRTFVVATGIDLSEADADISDYDTLEDLFVRKLKKGARRVDPDPVAFVSPVDGTLGMCGTVEDDTCLQVKGRSYSLSRLLGSKEDASRFEGGTYLTAYLAPYHYHRIHSPVAGTIERATLIPGRLMPVFQESVQRVDELFARNERTITYIDTPDAGMMAVVKVGATLVGRITLSYDPEVHTNDPTRVDQQQRTYSPAKLITKGGELGAFELGSTVVVLAEKGRLRLEDFEPGHAVRMGQRLGRINAQSRSSTVRAS